MKRPSPSLCCNACNPQLAQDLFTNMDPPPKLSRAAARIKLPSTKGLVNSQNNILLWAQLKSWREEAAEREWGPYFPLGGLGIISDSQIERIVGLACLGALPDTAALRAQLKWCYQDEYGANVISIVLKVYSAALQTLRDCKPAKGNSRKAPTPGPSSSASPEPCTPKVRKCSACGAAGHIGTHLVFSRYRR